jgi:hypothetical protein
LLPCNPSVPDLRALIETGAVVKKIEKLCAGRSLSVVAPNKLHTQCQRIRELFDNLKTFGYLPAALGSEDLFSAAFLTLKSRLSVLGSDALFRQTGLGFQQGGNTMSAILHDPGCALGRFENRFQKSAGHHHR